jgi:ABC-type branched-subunit amino acid transport system ATPase component
MLVLESVSTTIAGIQVLRGISCQFTRGSMVAIVGRNGAGKTTLLRAVMGLLPVREGRLQFGGHDLRARPTFEIARLGLAYVPQGRELFPEFTVGQNLMAGVLARHRDARELAPGLQAFPWLANRLDDRAGALSGGQQQQLAIARALVSRPSLLLLDEPLEGVQPSVVDEIARVLQARCEASGMGLLLVEQNVDIVLRLCTRVVFIEGGEARESVAAEAVGDDPARLDRFLGIGA